jgi:hypothetical protein
MDDFRIGSLRFFDSQLRQTKNESKKRRQPHVGPQEELTDQVMLSSAGETEEQPPCYLPASSHEETE